MERRYLKLLIQPPESEVCSQTSIAMVAGCSVEDAIAAMQSCKGALPRDFKHALKRLGIKTGRIVPAYVGTGETRARSRVPDLCIATLVNRGCTWGHAVAICDGIVYDPSISQPFLLQVYEEWIIGRGYSVWQPEDSTKRPDWRNQAQWDYFLPILSKPPEGPPPF